MDALHDLIKKIGRDTVTKRLGVTTQAVSNNLKQGSLPGDWYAVMQAMAKDVGSDCPMGFFRWRGDAAYLAAVLGAADGHNVLPKT